jgi:hypothetical protein
VKLSFLSSLLLFFVALGFLSPQLLAVTPAELGGEAVGAEEREESPKESTARRVRSAARIGAQPFLNISDLIRFCSTVYRGNIHLLQVFLV